MHPRFRRAVQALLYEGFALVFVAPALSFIFARPATSTLPLSVFMSAVALAWGYLFNTLFERWETRRQVKGRSLLRRLGHGLGFEGGLVALLVPVMAYWLRTSLLEAFLADLGILFFFFIYSVAFTWGFDRLFGLPSSAVGEYET